MVVRIFLSRQFLLFLVTGGFAAAVNFGSRIAYNRWTSYSTAIVLAYVTGMATAFILAKVFVFKETRRSAAGSALFFTLVNGLAVLQTWAVSMALYHYLLPWLGVVRHAPEIAHFVGIVIPVFTSYVGHKRWSFG